MFFKNLPVWLLALVCIGCADQTSLLTAPRQPPQLQFTQPQFNGPTGYVWGYVFFRYLRFGSLLD